VGFTRLRGFFGKSICSVVPWVFTVPWHPLEAEFDALPLNLGSCLEDRMDYALSRFIRHVLDRLQSRSAVA
jgi:hypothetical protein